MVRKNYVAGGGGIRAHHRGVRGTVAPGTTVGHNSRGSVCFQKNCNFCELGWTLTFYENYNFRRDLQLSSSKFFNLKSSS
jgi:hypothetical protein